MTEQKAELLAIAVFDPLEKCLVCSTRCTCIWCRMIIITSIEEIAENGLGFTILGQSQYYSQQSEL